MTEQHTTTGNIESQAQLHRLTQGYVSDLPFKIAVIEGYWCALMYHKWGCKKAEEMCQQIHSLAGSGITYGFSEIGKACKILEKALLPHLDNDTGPGVDKKNQINTALDLLKTIVFKICRADKETIHHRVYRHLE